MVDKQKVEQAIRLLLEESVKTQNVKVSKILRTELHVCVWKFMVDWMKKRIIILPNSLK